MTRSAGEMTDATASGWGYLPRSGERPRSSGLRVTVRYFAAARAAAGSETETLIIEPETTVAELVDKLSRRDPKLAAVLSRCSYLCDGVAVRDRNMALQSGHTVDVLPPFAGG